MARFSLLRRSRDADSHTASTLAPVPPHLMPAVNQRVSVAMGEHVPVPSRIEDITGGALVLAWPSLPLEFGDSIIVTWEREGAWFSLDTRVLGVDERATVPTVQVAAGGRLSSYDERRTDVRREIELPIELRVVRARALRPGRELQTTTVEVSSTAVRFVTSAPFAPGDLLEVRVSIGSGTDDEVSARVRVIRVDAVTGSWRSTCTATFDEILRSDRARLMALVAASVAGTSPAQEQQPRVDTAPLSPSTPPTLDGVGGRDQPDELGSFDGVVEWLRRRG